ncbi:endonuclease domain-containing 1 protein-like [Oculina patagonica]
MTPIQQLFLLLCFFAVVVKSEVGNDFSKCNQFFYKGIPPKLQRHFAQPPKNICQVYQNQYHDFATLYSTSLRIPLYSAYTLPDPCQGPQPNRRSLWFIEPQGRFLYQLSDTMGQRNIQTAGHAQQRMKVVQAINEDYENTGYDRGHLNPNFYQCNDSRTATFTLTNAVPQDPCFNQQSWKKMEEVSMDTLRQNCVGALRYFVTGVVKTRTRIPNEEHKTQENPNRDLNRVTVPSHMWTAACCYDPTNQGNGFSFAYIGKNAPDSIVEIISVSKLEAKLVSNDLGIDRYQSAKIFTDDCNENSQKSKDMRARVSVPMDKRVANTLDNLSRVEQSTIPLKKRKLVHQAVGMLASDKVAAYDYSFARMDLGITLRRNNTLLNKTRELLLDKNASLLLYRAHDLTPVTRPVHIQESDAFGIHTGSTKQDKNITVSRSIGNVSTRAG